MKFFDLHCSINRSIVRRSVSDAVQQNIFQKRLCPLYFYLEDGTLELPPTSVLVFGWLVPNVFHLSRPDLPHQVKEHFVNVFSGLEEA